MRLGRVAAVVGLVLVAVVLWFLLPRGGREADEDARTDRNARDSTSVVGTDADATLRGTATAEGAPSAATPDEPSVALTAGGWIEGRLVDDRDGNPVRRFRLRAFARPLGEDGHFDPLRAMSEAVLPAGEVCRADLRVDSPDGIFRVGPLSPAIYVLLLDVEGRSPLFEGGGAWGFQTRKGIRVEAGKTTNVGAVHLPPTGRFVLRVLDAATEKPLAGVRFFGAVEIGEREYAAPLQPTEIGDDGAYVLDLHTEDGRAFSTTVLTEKEGYGTVSLSFSGHEIGAHFEVRMAREAYLRGVVRASDGAPIENAVVAVRRDADRVTVATTVTDDEGRFVVAPLTAALDLELLVLVGQPPRLLTLLPLRLQPGEERRLEIGGPGVTAIAGHVRLAGEPIRQALVSLDGPNDRRTQFWTGEDGRFRFDGLNPGRYVVTVSASGPDVYVSRTVDVRGDALTRVELDLARRIRGRVRVIDLEGERVDPEDEISVRARLRRADPAQTGWWSEGDVDDDGTFEILLVEPGIYELESAYSGFVVLDRPSIDLMSDRIVENVEVDVVQDPADGRIRLRVQDAQTKEPIEDVGYEYSRKNTWGSGSADPKSLIERNDAELGTHRYVLVAPAHVSRRVEVEITPTVRSVERVVELQPADCVRIVSFGDVSRARSAGLRAGDLLVRYGEHRVRNLPELRVAMAAFTPDDAVSVEVSRDGGAVLLTLPGGRMGVNVANHHADLD